MSMMKHLIETQEQQRMEAIEIAVEANVLEKCEYHGEVYDAGVVDLQPAYKLANQKFTRRETYSFRSRREMTDAVKTVHREAAIECWQCEKEREEYP